MIILAQENLSELHYHAEKAYPEECCGLLAGISEGGQVHVTRVVPSKNVSDQDKSKTFEIDPQVRFDLMRELEDTTEELVGHFHSHPDRPATPSKTDIAMAYEPGLLWIIIGLNKGVVSATGAFRPTDIQTGFAPVDLQIRGITS